MASEERQFDIVIYGASGFTGQFVVEELAICTHSNELNKNDKIKWAIAGRSKDKLIKVLKEAKINTKIDIDHIPVIEANSDNYVSVLEMCKKTRLIVSVVGPFRFFGEPVVKACVEASTNYVDICGEPHFLESMQLKYFDEAKKKEIHLVGAAGWDSIPADCGITWTKNIFKGDLLGCETIMQIESSAKFKINYGTWWSAIYGYANSHDLRALRTKLFKEILPMPASKPKHELPRRGFMAKIEEFSGYSIPFMGADRSVVKRSEVYKYHHQKERPILCEAYFRVGSLMNVMKIIFVASIFAALTSCKFGRYLLERFPGFFSLGVVSKGGGIKRSDLMKSSFSNTIVGYGWNEKYEDLDSQHDEPAQKKIITRVSGPDPSYIATASFVIQAGITILKERSKLPGFGVLTPGAAFRDTNLIERLRKRNIKFEVLKEM